MVLADVVRGMRLAREDELHGPAGRVQDSCEPFRVGEYELGPLVACEPSREPDGERARIEQRSCGHDAWCADALFDPTRARALADEAKQMPAQRLPHRPELLVGNIQDDV